MSYLEVFITARSPSAQLVGHRLGGLQQIFELIIYGVVQL